MHTSRTSIIVVLLSVFAVVLPANATGNLLLNGKFHGEDNGGVGQLIGQGCGPNGLQPSGATHWVLCNDIAATTNSDREPSTLVNGGWMMHVTTNSPQGGSGIVQTFQPAANPTQYLCVWLNVVQGEVGVGAGDGSLTAISAVMLNQGTWEVLNVGNNPSAAQVSEVVIFSYGGPAEFYVGRAKLSSSHGQCAP